MLLVSTRSWDHYAVFLLVPFATIIAESGRLRRLTGPELTRLSYARNIEMAALGAFLLLVAQGYWVQLPRSIWLMSFGFYGMLVLWGCLVWMTSRRNG
jgi:hypothetical protein